MRTAEPQLLSSDKKKQEQVLFFVSCEMPNTDLQEYFRVLMHNIIFSYSPGAVSDLVLQSTF